MEYELFNCVPVVRKVQRRKSDVFELQDEPLPLVKSWLAKAARRPASRREAPHADAASVAERKTWSVSVQGETPSSTDEQEYRDAVARVLQAGGGILAAGGTSREAMEATIDLMEESLNHRISESATRH